MIVYTSYVNNNVQFVQDVQIAAAHNFGVAIVGKLAQHPTAHGFVRLKCARVRANDFATHIAAATVGERGIIEFGALENHTSTSTRTSRCHAGHGSERLKGVYLW